MATTREAADLIRISNILSSYCNYHIVSNTLFPDYMIKTIAEYAINKGMDVRDLSELTEPYAMTLISLFTTEKSGNITHFHLMPFFQDLLLSETMTPAFYESFSKAIKGQAALDYRVANTSHVKLLL